MDDRKLTARRRMEWTLLAVIALAMVAGIAVTGQQKAGSSPAKAAAASRIIEMTAVKFNFSPAEIRVKQGAKVTLKLTATDRKHGIEIHPYAVGADKKGPAGLRFPDHQREWKLEKDVVQVIEFIAERPGRYRVECSVFCGMRHNDMEGWIIVE